ncbi:P2Y purinoceptor 2-like isoform X3 [Sceloporus undulatus]|uniref:P2Y purinoceptor 2-like isoform X3 n=1 Tax=Sceloporus undulatus TaxID=8520 RepID=UPI001C4AA955|nr:P2Y purinoceptor 2-like isoform X3 [Sceloporus undulatus]XP_042336301.1 P2Y purinoceptor 2-like isoform X3 [Sceloporus undulatus]
MNMTNSTECLPQELHPAIPALLGIFSVAGLVFNAFSLWIFWFNLKRWNSSIMLQFNLALVDTMILPITPLMVSYFSLGNHWPFGEFLCQFEAFTLSTHLYGSIYFLMLISIHRYQAIVHYNAKTLWRKKSFLKKLILVFWTLLFFQGLPIFFFLKTSIIGDKVKCLSIHQSELSYLYLMYGIVLGTFCFFLPFGVSLMSYMMLGTYIAKISQANLRGRVMKRRSVQMIVVTLLIFAICFTPLHVFRTAGTIVKYYHLSCDLLHHIEVAYYISLVLTTINCCLDPFIYNFANEKFNKSFSSSLRRLFSS